MSRLIGAAILAGSLVSHAEAADSGATRTPVGVWRTVDEATGKARSIVRIREENGRLLGTIEQLIRDPGEDANPVCDKCEGELRGKPIRGMTVMRGLTRSGEKWTGGEILDPKSGKVYKCFIEVLDGGSRLKLRGFIGFSLLGRTQYWHREPTP